MSIEPEVPYDLDAELEEETWRDPSILPDSNAIQLAAAGGRDQQLDFLYDYQRGGGAGGGEERTPDDCWMVPPEFSLVEILGERRVKLQEMRRETNTYMDYNEAKHQIDIWGERSACDKAKEHLDLIVARLTERRDANRRKTKKWGKPERELTERERRRHERLQARRAEEKSYQGFPTIPQPYMAVVPLPDRHLPEKTLFGDKDSYINSIRAECKAYMWYEQDMNWVKIVGQEQENVTMAAARLRGWYYKCTWRPTGNTLRLMKQPGSNLLVRFATLPAGFVPYRYGKPAEQQFMLSQHRLFESARTGVINKIADANLIDLEDTKPDDDQAGGSGDSLLPERVRTLDARNKEQIYEALAEGLDSIRVFDWEIRMKVRFGQICAVDYPSKKSLFEIEDLVDKYFPNPKFVSKLAPCIGTTFEDVQPLFVHMANHGVQFSDSPRTTFSIQAEQYPNFVPKPPPGATRRDYLSPAARGDKWKTTIIANFTSDGRIGLWNCLTDCKDLVTVSCLNLESDYSWELKLEHGRRLPADYENPTPHSVFAENLRLNPQNNRLVLLVGVTDYEPKLVTQKTKWSYAYDDSWVIEIDRDEIWDIELLDISKERRDLPVDLSNIDPHRVIYKVSAYKESWVNRFAENLSLRIGELPTWTSDDFLESESENVSTIYDMAQKLVSILSREVPLYWNVKAQKSLV